MCSWDKVWITASERHNKQLRYKSTPVLCHSSPRGICHLSPLTTLLWWSSRHAPHSHTWGKSWERCHQRDKGPPEREQKKSNIIQSQNLGLQTPTLMTFHYLTPGDKIQDFLLSYSFTPVPTDQLNGLYLGKGCEHNLPILMLISVSP